MILLIVNGKTNQIYGTQFVVTKKKEQAIIVLLQSLNEHKKTEKTVSELKVMDLNVDDGFDKLIAKLDKTFKTEKTQESYNVCVEFNKFFRTENMNINDYILEFEHFNNKSYTLI